MKNKQTIWITILVLLVVGLTSYIITDKIILKNLSSNNNHQDSNETNQGEDNINEEQTEENVLVASYYSKAKEEILICERSNIVYVNIPTITSNKPGAVTLNKKIQNLYAKDIKYIESNDEKGRLLKINYDYTIIDNNIIIITMHNAIGVVCGSGVMVYQNFFYNIKEDKELTLLETLNALGFNETKDSIKNKFEEQYKYYNELDEEINNIDNERSTFSLHLLSNDLYESKINIHNIKIKRINVDDFDEIIIHK